MEVSPLGAQQLRAIMRSNDALLVAQAPNQLNWAKPAQEIPENLTMNKPDNRLIVADIGGTNGRFAVAELGPNPVPESLEFQLNYENAGLKSLTELLTLYRREVGTQAPRRICLAVAGPVQGEQGSFTNLDWVCDAQQLRRDCDFDDVLLVNDFAALAASTPYVEQVHLHEIVAGEACPESPISVIGPGTGLGVSMLIPDQGGWKVVATEGGHASFAPENEKERALLRYLGNKLTHVSKETLLSGDGLVRIHQFLCHESDISIPDLTPAEISRAAVSNNDENSVRSVAMFLELLASAVGDIVLMHGSRGGVFLGGGVLGHLLPLLDKATFSSRFTNKGPMRDYLAQVPVKYVNNGDAALVGAACFYHHERCLSRSCNE